MPPFATAAFPYVQLLFLVLALLIGDTAAGLASRLAGSLALTAATFFCAFAEVTGLDGLNSLHFYYPFVEERFLL